eukprot:GHVL01041588.1.p1 GENE.GHVL01041588.1~~GHVL01041588.1.p1  ORF type:complete len:627 (-),score=127.43 GHVL01041588.1:2553-4433(-)
MINVNFFLFFLIISNIVESHVKLCHIAFIKRTLPKRTITYTNTYTSSISVDIHKLFVPKMPHKLFWTTLINVDGQDMQFALDMSTDTVVTKSENFKTWTIGSYPLPRIAPTNIAPSRLTNWPNDVAGILGIDFFLHFEAIHMNYKDMKMTLYSDRDEMPQGGVVIEAEYITQSDGHKSLTVPIVMGETDKIMGMVDLSTAYTFVNSETADLTKSEKQLNVMNVNDLQGVSINTARCLLPSLNLISNHQLFTLKKNEKNRHYCVSDKLPFAVEAKAKDTPVAMVGLDILGTESIFIDLVKPALILYDETAVQPVIETTTKQTPNKEKAPTIDKMYIDRMISQWKERLSSLNESERTQQLAQIRRDLVKNNVKVDDLMDGDSMVERYVQHLCTSGKIESGSIAGLDARTRNTRFQSLVDKLLGELKSAGGKKHELLRSWKSNMKHLNYSDCNSDESLACRYAYSILYPQSQSLVKAEVVKLKDERKSGGGIMGNLEEFFQQALGGTGGSRRQIIIENGSNGGGSSLADFFGGGGAGGFLGELFGGGGEGGGEEEEIRQTETDPWKRFQTKCMSNPKAASIMNEAGKDKRVMKALEDVVRRGDIALGRYQDNENILHYISKLKHLMEDS